VAIFLKTGEFNFFITANIIKWRGISESTFIDEHRLISKDEQYIHHKHVFNILKHFQIKGTL